MIMGKYMFDIQMNEYIKFPQKHELYICYILYEVMIK